MAEFFELSRDEVDALLENTRRNLSDGNFKFVVLMDHLHDQLKDLIIFLNNNSEFTIYAVELEYYKHQDFEILIPKLYGAEVKKDIGKTVSQAIPTDEDFIMAYKEKPGLAKINELVSFFNDLREGRKEINNVKVSKTPKYLNFNITLNTNDKIGICLSINPEYEGGGLQIWTTKKLETKVKKIVSDKLRNAEILGDLKTQFGKVAKWKLENYLTADFEQLLRELAKI